MAERHLVLDKQGLGELRLKREGAHVGGGTQVGCGRLAPGTRQLTAPRTRQEGEEPTLVGGGTGHSASDPATVV